MTDNLRAMEADGLITRTVYPEVPPRVEYALSEWGAATSKRCANRKRESDRHDDHE